MALGVQGKGINSPLSPSETAGGEGVFPLVVVGWSTIGIVIKFFLVYPFPGTLF